VAPHDETGLYGVGMILLLVGLTMATTVVSFVVLGLRRLWTDGDGSNIHRGEPAAGRPSRVTGAGHFRREQSDCESASRACGACPARGLRWTRTAPLVVRHDLCRWRRTADAAGAIGRPLDAGMASLPATFETSGSMGIARPTRDREERFMSTQAVLYVIAIICLVVAALPITVPRVSLGLLGAAFALAGYAWPVITA
jgi:hypothetical protein